MIYIGCKVRGGKFYVKIYATIYFTSIPFMYND